MIRVLRSALGIHSLPSERMKLQKQIRRTTKNSSNERKQLLVDVSVIIREDAGTGIQRVVRALLRQLFMTPPEGYRILPVFCTRKNGYRYAHSLFLHKFTTEPIDMIPEGKVIVKKNDLFFGLDLNISFLPIHEDEICGWKEQGVKVHMLMYDMLPHLHPEWFTPRAVKNFNRWLRMIAVYSDSIICISKTVQGELRTWLRNQGFSEHTPNLNFIPLGSEINDTLPTIGINNYENIFHTLENSKFILMVGTIEPRKGYDEVMAAMEALWSQGDETSLVIVGKPGWKTVALQKSIINHPEMNKKLYWLKDITDQSLQKLYEMSMGVLVASRGEGFGLPIVEAMFYKKALLVRDIPVFCEISNQYNGISYFKELKGNLIRDWIKGTPLRIINNLPNITWEESQKKLISIMIPCQQTSECELSSANNNIYNTRL